jgi:hypothetical protein
MAAGTQKSCRRCPFEAVRISDMLGRLFVLHTGTGNRFFPLPHFEPSANLPMNLLAPKPV